MALFKEIIKKKAQEEALLKHSLNKAEESVRNDYIQSLIFIAVSDGNYSKNEKSYIETIANSVGIDKHLLSSFEEFAKEPNNDELLKLMDRLKTFDKKIKINLMIDSAIVAYRDADFNEDEMELFDEYITILELKEEKENILSFVTNLNTITSTAKNIESLTGFMFSALTNSLYRDFEYMVDIVKLADTE